MFADLMTLIPRRLFNLAGFLFCAGLLGYGYHVQFNQGLEPCPLCIFQRVAFMATGIVFLAVGRRIDPRSTVNGHH